MRSTGPEIRSKPPNPFLNPLKEQFQTFQDEIVALLPDVSAVLASGESSLKPENITKIVRGYSDTFNQSIALLLGSRQATHNYHYPQSFYGNNMPRLDKSIENLSPSERIYLNYMKLPRPYGRGF